MKDLFRLLVLVGLLVAVLLTFLVVHAQSGAGFDFTWNTLDGGGLAKSSGGDFTLYGTYGQPDASNELIGNDYSLAGGFWSGIHAYFLNLPALFQN